MGAKDPQKFQASHLLVRNRCKLDPKIEIALAAKPNLDIIPFNVTPLKLSKRCRILTSCFNHTSSHDHFFESLIIAFDCGADQPVDCSCVEIDSSESPSSKAPFAQSTAAALSAISSLENSLFCPYLLSDQHAFSRLSCHLYSI